MNAAPPLHGRNRQGRRLFKRRRSSLTGQHSSQKRRGTAVTEFAIFLPILLAFSLVPLELAAMIFVNQSLRVAAYETARVASKKLGTYADAEDQGEQILNERSLQDWSIEISPAEATLHEGDLVTVTVTAGYAANAVVGFIYTNSILTGRMVMTKE